MNLCSHTIFDKSSVSCILIFFNFHIHKNNKHVTRIRYYKGILSIGIIKKKKNVNYYYIDRDLFL